MIMSALAIVRGLQVLCILQLVLLQCDLTRGFILGQHSSSSSVVRGTSLRSYQDPNAAGTATMEPPVTFAENQSRDVARNFVPFTARTTSNNLVKSNSWAPVKRDLNQRTTTSNNNYRPSIVTQNDVINNNLRVSHLDNYSRAKHDLGYGGERMRQESRRLSAPPGQPLPKRVDGGARSYWTSAHPYYNEQERPRSYVSMETDGRPLHGEVKLWEGPGNTPQKVRVYSEDGYHRRFQTLVETPRRDVAHTFSVKNVGSLEFPMVANVHQAAPNVGTPRIAERRNGPTRGKTRAVSGGALKTFAVGGAVQQVEVRIETQGLPIMATVELWEGPGHARQVAEIYVDDGYSRPFSALIDTPGDHGCTIAVRNQGTIEFPIEVSVEPYA